MELFRPLYRINKKLLFWGLIAIIWIISTYYDRTWWNNSNLVPAWDQADYLNSALSHGRALGVLQGGAWEGFRGLISHSPKIPPLASFVNGTIIAFSGDAPKDAAWSLSIWHGLLLFSVAGIGAKLNGRFFSCISVIFVSIAPALVALRLNYVLEMPLCAATTLAIWQLGSWVKPDSDNNKK